jgi:ferrous iron transport protein B
MMKKSLNRASWVKVESILLEHDDAQLSVASGRYEWIERATRRAVERPKTDAIIRTRRFDRIATHPVWGVFTMLGILIAAITAAMAIGMPISMGIMNSVSALGPVPGFIRKWANYGVGGAETIGWIQQPEILLS